MAIKSPRVLHPTRPPSPIRLGSTALTVNAPAPPSSATYAYTAPSGSQVSVTVNYASYTVQTNFGCSGIAEYGATAQDLVSSMSLPDSTSYIIHLRTHVRAIRGNVTGPIA